MRWIWAKFQVPNETSLKTHRVPVLHPDPDLFCHRGLFKYAAVKPGTNQDLGSRAFKAQVWAVCSPCCQWRPALNASSKTPGCAPHACGHPWSRAGVVQVPHPAGGRRCPAAAGCRTYPGLPTASQPPLCAAIRQQRHNNAWSDRSSVLLNPQHCLYRKARGLSSLHGCSMCKWMHPLQLHCMGLYNHVQVNRSSLHTCRGSFTLGRQQGLSSLLAEPSSAAQEEPRAAVLGIAPSHTWLPHASLWKHQDNNYIWKSLNSVRQELNEAVIISEYICLFSTAVKKMTPLSIF